MIHFLAVLPVSVSDLIAIIGVLVGIAGVGFGVWYGKKNQYPKIEATEFKGYAIHDIENPRGETYLEVQLHSCGAPVHEIGCGLLVHYGIGAGTITFTFAPHPDNVKSEGFERGQKRRFRLSHTDVNKIFGQWRDPNRKRLSQLPPNQVQIAVVGSGQELARFNSDKFAMYLDLIDPPRESPAPDMASSQRAG